jgi:hypothetical protein
MDAQMRSDRPRSDPTIRDKMTIGSARECTRIDRWSSENNDGEVFKNCWTLLHFADAARYRVPK